MSLFWIINKGVMVMQVRWAEDLEILRYGMVEDQEKTKKDRQIKTVDLDKQISLKDFIAQNNIKLEVTELVRQAEKYGMTRLIFYDLVYVNRHLQSDNNGVVSDYLLKDDDFILISRSNAGSFIPRLYPWAVYHVSDLRPESPKIFRERSAKRQAIINWADVLLYDNYFKSMAMISEDSIRINDGQKNIFDKLEWGDKIIIR